MASRLKFTDPQGIYFLTLTTVGWINVFCRRAYCDLLVDSLRYCRDHKGLRIYGYVIMSNHLHLLAQCTGDPSMPEILRDFKKFTARKIIEWSEKPIERRSEWLLYLLQWYGKKSRRKQGHRLWRSDNHPFLVFTPRLIRQKLNYIHQNPVKAGIVYRAEDYRYSSARNYRGWKSPLEVSLLDLGSTEGYIFMGP